jgi:hypothetical protein
MQKLPVLHQATDIDDTVVAACALVVAAINGSQFVHVVEIGIQATQMEWTVMCS